MGIFVDIMTVTLDGHLNSFAVKGSIHRFKYPDYAQALNAAADRALLCSDTLQKMSALIFQRFDRLNPGTDDVTLADLEPKFAVSEGLRVEGDHAFFTYPDLLNAVQIVEHNAFIVLHHHDFASFVRIGPAYVDMREHIVGITQRDKSNIVPAVSQDLTPHRTDPCRRFIKEVVEDGNVVRREIPQGIHIATNGSQICSACVKIV